MIIAEASKSLKQILLINHLLIVDTEYFLLNFKIDNPMTNLEIVKAPMRAKTQKKTERL